MPAYSILAWLRRRRAVTRAVRRPTEAFRSAFSIFTGRYYSARPPLLLPPARWREKLRTYAVDARGGTMVLDDVEPVDVMPAIAVEEIRIASPTLAAPRIAYRDDRRRSPEPGSEQRSADVQLEATRDERAWVDETVLNALPAQLADAGLMREPTSAPAEPGSSTPERSSSIPFVAAAAAEPTAPASSIERNPATNSGNAAAMPEPITPTAPAIQTQQKTVRDDRAIDVVAASDFSEAIGSESASEPVRRATTLLTPTVDTPASQPSSRAPILEPTADVQRNREATPAPPNIESATRLPTSAPHSRPGSTDRPPTVTRPDSRVPQTPTPLSPATRPIERRSESVAPSTDVEVAAEASSTLPIVSASLPDAPDQEVATRSTDDLPLGRHDDSLMKEVEPRETVAPARTSVQQRDVPRAELLPESSAPRSTGEPSSDIREQVTALERSDIQATAASAPPPIEVEQESPPIIARRSAEPASPPDSASTGRRPTEERRGRRSRPPVPSETTQTPGAKALEVSKKNEQVQQPNDIAASADGRSMTDWRRLLFEATTDPKTQAARAAASVARGTEKARPASAQPTTTRPAPAMEKPIETEPLLESTRRFLRPRVGIDPATVPVVRGPIADRLVRDAGADAAAVADAVVLPSEHDERSPRTLGLIAHELTHVAQRREPRFVPPVIRTPIASVRSNRRSESHAPLHSSSEEQLARAVERSVWNEAEFSAHRQEGFATDDAASQASAPRSNFGMRAEREPSEWGGLPAPWEPLPVFAASASAEVASAPLAVPASAGEQTIHYAEHGRELEGEASSSAHASHADAAPPPDLDVLARKVYDVLKRRLAAERRREG